MTVYVRSYQLASISFEKQVYIKLARSQGRPMAESRLEVKGLRSSSKSIFTLSSLISSSSPYSSYNSPLILMVL
jgi:hypothetical protein